MAYNKTMEDKQSSYFQLTTRETMNVITLKPFTTRDPKSGRTYKYTVGEVVKGRKLDFIQPRHFAAGIFAEVGTIHGTASAIRRRDGRREWHAANGTDREMDLEYQVYAVLSEVFSNDELLSKGSGQTGIINRMLREVKETFEGRYHIETLLGTDDPEAKRMENSKRDFIWAHDEVTKLEAISLLTKIAISYR